MKIATRHFLIPECPDEIALCMNTKNLSMVSINYKDRTFSVWTEEDNNSDLLHDFLSDIDNKYYFESILINEDSNPKSIAVFFKVCFIS